jgi:iron complex outermembrane receptor protein
MVPGLTVTADYFNISIDGAIDTFGGGLNNALNTCYNVVQDINAPECQIFSNGVRNNAGVIDVSNPPLLVQANTATLETSGVDVEVNYTMTIPFSLLTDTGEQRLGLSFLGTWTDKFDRTPAIGLPVNECAGRFGNTCGSPIPKYKWTSRATFMDGPMTTSLRWRHLGAVSDDDDATDYAAFNGVERIDAYDLLDVTLAFDINENATFTFGVNNVFNTLPFTPTFDADGYVVGRDNNLLLGDNQEQANTYPSIYDVIGRDFFASVAFKF